MQPAWKVLDERPVSLFKHRRVVDFWFLTLWLGAYQFDDKSVSMSSYFFSALKLPDGSWRGWPNLRLRFQIPPTNTEPAGKNAHDTPRVRLDFIIIVANYPQKRELEKDICPAQNWFRAKTVKGCCAIRNSFWVFIDWSHHEGTQNFKVLKMNPPERARPCTICYIPKD